MHDTNENPGFIFLSDLLIKVGLKKHEISLPINNEVELNESIKKIEPVLNRLLKISLASIVT